MRGYRSNYKPWRVADRAAMVTVVPPRQASAWPRQGHGVAFAGRAIDEARERAYPGKLIGPDDQAADMPLPLDGAGNCGFAISASTCRTVRPNWLATWLMLGSMRHPVLSVFAPMRRGHNDPNDGAGREREAEDA